jgi:CheY-like chemotaxis protein/Tfp pilus assembly protein PilZ
MNKILLVDDVKLLLELQKRFLASSQVEILTAADGAEALDIARREVPDLIVTDKYMPNMDGIACCAAIKSDPSLRHIPVILVSNAILPEEGEEYRSLGFADYLSKPLDGRKFLNTVRTFLPAVERRSARIPCAFEVRLVVGGALHDGVSHDISLNGMYVATDLALVRGDELLLDFSLPGSSHSFVVRARVAWANRRPASGSAAPPKGLGIEFVEITGHGLPLLRTSELKSFLAAASPATN